MQQKSLFDDGSAVSPRSAVAVPGVGAAKLTKAQKQFNKLIERIGGQRQDLERWQAFGRVYQQQLAERYQPLAVRLRAKRIAMVELLDRAMGGKSLDRRERAKVRDILVDLLAQLLAEAESPELVRLHDKYADSSFAEAQRDRMDLMRSFVSEELGMNVESYQGGDSPEELADWLREQVQSARAEPDAPRRQNRGAKAVAREAEQRETAEGGTRAVREVFRKLASELHPDRETDPAEQRRKTELMQRVNQAYKSGDLLALLELQLSIEQIDATALANLADERLRHYVHVLEEQSRRLGDEIAEVMAPFKMALGGPGGPKLTPDSVQRALDLDVRDLQGMLRSIEKDLAHFTDIGRLRQSLRDFEIEAPGDDEWGLLDELRRIPAARRQR